MDNQPISRIIEAFQLNQPQYLSGGLAALYREKDFTDVYLALIELDAKSSWLLQDLEQGQQVDCLFPTGFRQTPETDYPPLIRVCNMPGRTGKDGTCIMLIGDSEWIIVQQPPALKLNSPTGGTPTSSTMVTVVTHLTLWLLAAVMAGFALFSSASQLWGWNLIFSLVVTMSISAILSVVKFFYEGFYSLGSFAAALGIFLVISLASMYLHVPLYSVLAGIFSGLGIFGLCWLDNESARPRAPKWAAYLIAFFYVIEVVLLVLPR